MTRIYIAPVFELGRTVITRNALNTIGNEGAQEALSRHAVCDWGEVGDPEANDEALETGARLLSIYTINDTKVWVITDAETDVCPACWAGLGQCQPDRGEWLNGTHFRSDLPLRRVATTVMLPQDY